MSKKYVRALIGFTRCGESRLHLQRGWFEDSKLGQHGFVALLVRVPAGAGDLMKAPAGQAADNFERALRAAGDPWARPRSLRRRVRIAATVRHVADELGWNLTEAEEAMIAELQEDRTVDTTAQRLPEPRRDGAMIPAACARRSVTRSRPASAAPWQRSAGSSAPLQKGTP